ncbi:MAG: DUF2934 domain-containing protein [Alphaproteobacteria bacterium]|nr:DUF2934 domain-containing protein [Alphaproteobacteria bacterium]
MATKCNENYIREAAYYLWQNAGCPMDQDEKFWSMAVAQISSCNCSNSGCKKSSSTTKKATTKSAATKSATASKTSSAKKSSK